MKENKIKKRSVAIKECIEEATSKETTKSLMIELDKKLNNAYTSVLPIPRKSAHIIVNRVELNTYRIIYVVNS